jgi:cellulose biosynthesis protein BcsQ
MNDRIRLLIAAPFAEVQPVMAVFSPENSLGIDVATICQHGPDVEQDALEHGVDVVLLSPLLSGYDSDVIGRLARNPDRPIVVIGLVPPNGDWGVTMSRAGARGYVETPLDAAKAQQIAGLIPRAIKEAYAGRASNSYIPQLDPRVAAAITAQGYARQTVSVWSPKGGANRPTLLIDANMVSGHVAHLLNLRPKRTIRNLATLFLAEFPDADPEGAQLGPSTLREHATHFGGNLDALAGILRQEQASEPALRGRQGARFVKALLETAGRMYEFVVIDLGSSFNNVIHRGVLLYSHLVLTIADTDRTTLSDVRNGIQAMVAAFQEEGLDLQRFQILLNRFDPNAGFSRREIAGYVGLTEYGCIDREVNGAMIRAVNTGHPFVLNTFSSKDRKKDPLLRSYVALGATVFPPLSTIYESGRMPGRKEKRGLARIFGR